MSISHKTAWIQLVIFGLLFIGLALLAGINGTVFLWQNTAAKDLVYYFCAGAWAVTLGLNLTVGIATRGRTALCDERDRAIFRTASFVAAAVTLTVVLIVLLVTGITAMNQDSSTVSVYVPLFTVLFGTALLMLVQAIASVILYGRTVHHG